MVISQMTQQGCVGMILLIAQLDMVMITTIDVVFSVLGLNLGIALVII